MSRGLGDVYKRQVIAFSFGYLVSNGLDIYAGKMTDTDINEHKAKEISDEVDDFESRA